MQLNPLKWFSTSPQHNKTLPGANLTAREVAAQGPYTQLLSDYVARQVAPDLYETLREAVPVLDAAINRLVTLDGIIRVGGDNEKLVKKIDYWMRHVQVNDMQIGFQSFYAGMSNELYEQGFSIGEPVLAADKKSVAQLLVADSKGVYFKRAADGTLETWYRKPAPRNTSRTGTDNIERVLRNNYNGSNLAAYLNNHDYKYIDATRLVYAGLHNEADNPYGVSLMRSLEFVSKVLLTIDNATLHTWERFGNPVFDVVYKTKSKLTPQELEARRALIANNLSSAMSVKLQGKSADFVNAVGASDELTIKVLGGEGNVLEIEMPSKHILEQIVAKTGLPPWILGYVWGTAERLALKQSELLMQESKTRFELRQPGLENIVALHLRAQGETWQEGDWYLYQELPNMQDVVAQAQAEFLEAQTELMRSNTTGDLTVDPVETDDTGKVVKIGGLRLGKAKTVKAATDGEAFAENDPKLPINEASTIAGMLAQWHALEADTLAVLGLDTQPAKAAEDEALSFIFSAADMLPELRALENEFLAAFTAEEAPYIRGLYQAWLRGIENAAGELPSAADIVAEQREAMRQTISDEAMRLVRNTTTRSYRDDIVQDLQQGVYDGLNPRDVARQLRNRFDVHNYDWERLARSELTAAHARGKMDEYTASEVEQYNYTTAGDSKVSSICRALEANGPYELNNGPLPMRDSHPNCRCTVTAVVPE